MDINKVALEMTVSELKTFLQRQYTKIEFWQTTLGTISMVPVFLLIKTETITLCKCQIITLCCTYFQP